MKKYVSLALILVFTSVSTALGVQAAPLATNTPEATLLSRVITISGENLPREQWEEETDAALKDYSSTAQTQGRDERLEQALVTLGIYTPTQASTLMAQAHAAQSRIASLTPSQLNPEQQALPQALQTELGQILQTMPQGAQFGGCQRSAMDFERAGVGAFIVGVIGILAQGNHVPLENWASITAFSGFGLAVIGIAVSYGC